MKTLSISLAAGIAAGLLDILPMLMKRLPRREVLSAFLHYLVASVLIFHADLPGIPWYLEGGLIALGLALPVMVLVGEKEPKAPPVMGFMALLLGSLIGLAGHYLK